MINTERQELIELAHKAVQEAPADQSAIAAIVDAMLAAGYRKGER